MWGYLHDAANNLYKSYGSGTCNLTLSIYRPDGSCAYTYTYNNSDNNWIGQKLDRTGVWKIQSRISGSLVGTNTQTINVKDTNRSTYNDVFASVKGKGYSLNQARESASSTFRKGEFVYVWGYLHDAANNLYKSYGSGTCNLTLSIYRPDAPALILTPITTVIIIGLAENWTCQEYGKFKVRFLGHSSGRTLRPLSFGERFCKRSFTLFKC